MSSAEMITGLIAAIASLFGLAVTCLLVLVRFVWLAASTAAKHETRLDVLERDVDKLSPTVRKLDRFQARASGPRFDETSEPPPKR